MRLRQLLIRFIGAIAPHSRHESKCLTAIVALLTATGITAGILIAAAWIVTAGPSLRIAYVIGSLVLGAGLLSVGIEGSRKQVAELERHGHDRSVMRFFSVAIFGMALVCSAIITLTVANVWLDIFAAKPAVSGESPRSLPSSDYSGRSRKVSP